jgi:hypothetical protein
MLGLLVAVVGRLAAGVAVLLGDVLREARGLPLAALQAQHCHLPRQRVGELLPLQDYRVHRAALAVHQPVLLLKQPAVHAVEEDLGHAEDVENRALLGSDRRRPAELALQFRSPLPDGPGGPASPVYPAHTSDREAPFQGH